MIVIATIVILWVVLFFVNTRVSRSQGLWRNFAYTDVLMFYTLNVLFAPLLTLFIIVSLLCTSNLEKERFGLIKRLLNPAISEYLATKKKHDDAQEAVSAMQSEYSTYSSLKRDSEDSTEDQIFDSKVEWAKTQLNNLQAQEKTLAEKLVVLKGKI